jgi:hypothetical protein
MLNRVDYGRAVSDSSAYTSAVKKTCPAEMLKRLRQAQFSPVTSKVQML